MILRRRIFQDLQLILRLSISSLPKIKASVLKVNPLLAFSFGISTAILTTPITLRLLAASKQKSTMEEEIKKAEDLYSAHSFKELYEYLLTFKDCDNPEILWRLVRAARDRSIMNEVGKEEKKTIIYGASEVSKRALELGPDNYACHKWYGIMLSQTGDYEGTKKKIEDSPAMKKHFEKAAELNPEDSTSRHLIGMWCYSFAELSWFQRKIATVVFGAPPESTYDEALQHFLKAEELSPSGYSTNQLMIARCYLKMGKKVEAKEWFQKLEKFKAISDEDLENVEKAGLELKSL